MPTVDTILKDIQRLHTIEKEEILNYLEEILVFRVYFDKVADEVKENRFSRGKVCPHCGFEHISRNGKYNGRQRYVCKSCKKTVTDFTKSPHHYSKMDIDKWLLYAKCMINGYNSTAFRLSI